MLTVLALLLVSASASVSVEAFSNVYRRDWDGNRQNSFFDPATFGYQLYADHPQTIVKTNRAFRDEVNRAHPCAGKWCSKGLYSCTHTGNTDCYHVEHIIDTNGPEFASCRQCKDVAANRVMAYGRWNMALGAIARRNYTAATGEKALVYGAEAMRRARASIALCCRLMGVGNPYVYAGPTTPSANVTDPECDCDPEDPNCDAAAPCECDSDSACGCDCDFAEAAAVSISVDTDAPSPAVLALRSLTLGTIVLSSATIVLLLIRRCARADREQPASAPAFLEMREQYQDNDSRYTPGVI